MVFDKVALKFSEEGCMKAENGSESRSPLREAGRLLDLAWEHLVGAHQRERAREVLELQMELDRLEVRTAADPLDDDLPRLAADLADRVRELVAGVASESGEGRRRPAAPSRSERDVGNDALRELEEALSSPAPGRVDAWRDRADAAITQLIVALNHQHRSDDDEHSLLSEVAREAPRLVPRIEQLREEHRRIRADLLDAQAAVRAGADVEEIRDRLSDIGRRYRRHRTAEADLVYEAVNVDLGVGD